MEEVEIVVHEWVDGYLHPGWHFLPSSEQMEDGRSTRDGDGGGIEVEGKERSELHATQRLHYAI